jgi:hypothetical protein
MKKIVVFFLFVFWASSLAWGQDYPVYTAEQVAFDPESYLGMTVYFEYVTLFPALSKSTTFGDEKYRVSVNGRYGGSYGSWGWDDEITFYLGRGIAGKIINAQLGDYYYKANFLCSIEKKSLLTSGATTIYWLARIAKIEILDSSKNIVASFTDDAEPAPANPIGDAVRAERARWDANGDNKIGLPEAIRALQIVSGMREPPPG